MCIPVMCIGNVRRLVPSRVYSCLTPRNMTENRIKQSQKMNEQVHSSSSCSESALCVGCPLLHLFPVALINLACIRQRLATARNSCCDYYQFYAHFHSFNHTTVCLYLIGNLKALCHSCHYFQMEVTACSRYVQFY